MKLMRKTNPKFDIGPDQEAGLIEMCEWLQKTMPQTNTKTMVEIGTYVGESAEIFSRYFKKVYTVDPWEQIHMKAITTDKNMGVDVLYAKLFSRIMALGNIEFIRAPSALAALEFDDKCIDFVYIDAWHRVIPTTVDIMSWLPKIKPGGYIGGHDYRTEHYCEVIPAVRYVLSSPDAIFGDSSWVKLIPNRKRSVA